MDNILFTIDTDGTVTLWAPINSWESHILYQRASIRSNSSDALGVEPSLQNGSAFCVLIDNTELTSALATVFNTVNATDAVVAGILAEVAEIAERSPELCLTLHEQGNTLCVWGVEV